MKKFCIFCLTVMLCFSAVAASALTLTGDSLWAISDQQHITGIIDPNKVENYFGPQEPEKPYIRGFLKNGLVREKGLQSYVVSTSGQFGGFTTMRVKLEIFPQYEEIVAEVVQQKCGYVPDDVFDYILATMYFEDSNVGHVFFKTNIPTYHVGTITVNNGKDTIELYMGDFDFDGQYDLGFAAGWTPCKKPCPCKWQLVCVTQTVITTYTYIRSCFKNIVCK